MKASEAKLLTQQNELKIESILKNIESDAKTGRIAHRTPPDSYITDETKNKLMGLGYRLSLNTLPFGEIMLTVEW